MLVRDVAIHTTEGLFQDSERLIYSELAPRDRFNLSDDLWVGKLDDGVVDAVFDACEPPGRFLKKPVRPYGQLYAFVRERAPIEPPYEWDSDSRLQLCVALSRLVHPTSISFRYAARIVYLDSAKIDEIIPGPVTGHGADACPPIAGHRDWLVASDLDALKLLVQHLPLSYLPPRVWRALWYHEYAARTRYIDVKWTLISTALEAVVHTDKYKSTWQFTGRVPQLARELGGCEFSEADAETAYDCRSGLSHGQGLAILSKETREIYERMESVLRQTLMRCIREAEFAAIFSGDNTIRDRWPLSLGR
jgi:hypothetical protein